MCLIAKEVHSRFTKENLVENDINEDAKAKQQLVDDVEDLKVKQTAKKDKTKPEIVEEKSVVNEIDVKPKSVSFEEAEKKGPSEPIKSVTEPEVIEEKSFWDDVDDDGLAKPVKMEKIDAAPKKARKSITEPEEIESKTWDENHNEKPKKPVVEEVHTETLKGEKEITKPEEIEEAFIDESIKSPKRKSIKKQSMEEPLSAESEGKKRALCFLSTSKQLLALTSYIILHATVFF